MGLYEHEFKKKGKDAQKLAEFKGAAESNMKNLSPKILGEIAENDH